MTRRCVSRRGRLSNIDATRVFKASRARAAHRVRSPRNPRVSARMASVRRPVVLRFAVAPEKSEDFET
jgi:hypothetical protein